MIMNRIEMTNEKRDIYDTRGNLATKRIGNKCHNVSCHTSGISVIVMIVHCFFLVFVLFMVATLAVCNHLVCFSFEFPNVGC